MKRVYNENKLIQAIKRSRKTTLVWQRKDGVEYLTNSLWLIAAESFPIKVRALLFETFETLVQDGQSLSVRFGTLQENTVDAARVYEPKKQTETGEVLKLLTYTEKDTVQLVRLGEQTAGIYKEYMDLVDNKQKEFVAGLNDNQPVYFGEDRNMLICPVRMENGWGKFVERQMGLRGTDDGQ